MKSIKIYILLNLITLFALPSTGRAQNRPVANTEAQQKKQQEAAAYYAHADTACYGVRYRFKYLYDKYKSTRYEEDRITLVAPKMTMDMSYESIGERRWRMNHPESKSGDRSLAYHLTPSYYFFYPEKGRAVHTYRIISEEFLLKDTLVDHHWTLHEDTKQIGEYTCKKATCTISGRKWTAWYTTELPYVAAPRNLYGLKGVVLEAEDAEQEVIWSFNGIVHSTDNDKLYLKFPDRFTDIPIERFPQIVKLFAISDSFNYIQMSGVLEKSKASYPEKFRPSTGIDAWEVTNPIEK